MKTKRSAEMAVAVESRLNTDGAIALEQLFQMHCRRMLRAAYRITGSMADAEDIAQAIFLRVAQQPAEVIGNAESYLYRAAINASLDVIRNRKAGRLMAMDSADDLPSVRHSDSPDHAVRVGEMKVWLRTALAELSPRAAEMVVLRYVEECTNREIAQMMRTSQAVVAVTLHHARARLKKHYEKLMRGER